MAAARTSGSGGEVVRQGPRPLAHDGQREALAGGQELVAQGEFGDPP